MRILCSTALHRSDDGRAEQGTGGEEKDSHQEGNIFVLSASLILCTRLCAKK